MIRKFRLVFLLILILNFQACSINSDSIKSIAQSNSATQIEEYKTEVLKLLLEYKKKLDLRNPYSYNKQLSAQIKHQMIIKQNSLNLIQNNKKLTSYQEYLYYAFSQEDIKNRNDFLILGMYKLIYKAFSLDKGHRFIATQYNRDDMVRLYEYLQVIRWKIRTNKDNHGEYLFKTWQNNWQLELAKNDLSNLNIIKELKYIKEKKETIFDHSNFSFEIIISSMLVNIEHVLRKINIEPYEMGISAIKSFVFII